jgi:magnesium-transporting ATPase (P-type)
MSFKTVDGKIVSFTLMDHFKEWLGIGLFLSVIGTIAFAFYYFEWSFQKVIQTIMGLWLVYCAIAAGGIIAYYGLEALFQKYNIKSKILFWCTFLLLVIIVVPLMFILQNSCDFNLFTGQCN